MITETTDSTSEQDRIFSTMQREIAVAAREQGGEADDNFRLRYAVRRAEEANMPEDLIERARRQGVGEVAGPTYEEVIFEGYGPDGIAVLVEAITDDVRRTSHELEELFEAHGGNLGDDGCVEWQFERRGVVRVDTRHVDDEDQFMLEVIEMGGDELRGPILRDRDDGRVPTYRIFCDSTDVRQLDRAMEQTGYPVHTASTMFEPTQRVELSAEQARRFLSFFEKITDHEDVQGAYANWSVA